VALILSSTLGQPLLLLSPHKFGRVVDVSACPSVSALCGGLDASIVSIDASMINA